MKKFTCNIDRKKAEKEISPLLYGLFFEDINCSADGGMNAEQIANNSFEYEYLNYNDKGEKTDIRYDRFKHWTFAGEGKFSLNNANPLHKNNPTYLSVTCKGAIKLKNSGYSVLGSGFGIETQLESYNFSVFLRNNGFKGKVLVYLEDADGIISSVEQLNCKDKSFTKAQAKIEVNKCACASFVLEIIGEGEIDLDYFSLISSNAYGNCDKWTEGRLKPQFVEILRQLNPKFLRFPGGCIVEGDADFNNMYFWKNTVGKLHERKQNANTWGYLQSFAVGFYEYFLLCEELNIAPLPVLPCGLLCQIRTGNRGDGDVSIARGSKEFYADVIQNIVHLIYFAKGDVNSDDSEERMYASLRQDMGHKQPFNLKMLGIGNENWKQIYFDNLDEALGGIENYKHCNQPKNIAKMFDITYVLSVGVDIRPIDTCESWRSILKKHPNVIVDEHVYNSYEWFVDNAYRYDAYPRDITQKIFMGEYGMHSDSDGRGRLGGKSNVGAAVAEAAFLTGCERNGDIVAMTCYAPLFAKTDGYRWTPDLIWFNNRSIMRTPSYYVQKLFAQNVGTKLIPTSTLNKSIAGGIFIGGYKTEISVKSVTVIKDKNVIFSHDFSNGIGEFKVYPDCKGGEIKDGALIIKSTESLNGYYLDKDFDDCEVTATFAKISGEEGFILGMGLSGTKQTDCLDKDDYSLWLNYGIPLDNPSAKPKSVAFEKRFRYKRVAFEVVDGVNAELSGVVTLGLKLDKGLLTASRYGTDGVETLFAKKVHKADDIALSATTDGKNTFIKAINTSNQPIACDFNLIGEDAAEVITLSGDFEQTNSIDNYGEAVETIAPTKQICAVKDGKLNLTLAAYSVNIIKTL